MALSVLSIEILKCIRSRIREPKAIADELNVEFSEVKEHLDWLVHKKYITPDGRLTKKGFIKAPQKIERK
jgi:predicted transcriptional regulator